jgi:hypothetical protein
MESFKNESTFVFQEENSLPAISRHAIQRFQERIDKIPESLIKEILYTACMYGKPIKLSRMQQHRSCSVYYDAPAVHYRYGGIVVVKAQNSSRYCSRQGTTIVSCYRYRNSKFDRSRYYPSN